MASSAGKKSMKKSAFQRRKKIYVRGGNRYQQPMATKATPKKTTTSTTKTTTATPKRKPNAAFLKPVTPDEKLAAVVGAKPLPRTEIVSKLWAYIKKNNLQDKKVKTQINADDVLKAIFDGKKSVTMFEMNKYVSNHLVK